MGGDDVGDARPLACDRRLVLCLFPEGMDVNDVGLGDGGGDGTLESRVPSQSGNRRADELHPHAPGSQGIGDAEIGAGLKGGQNGHVHAAADLSPCQPEDDGRRAPGARVNAAAYVQDTHPCAFLTPPRRAMQSRAQNGWAIVKRLS